MYGTWTRWVFLVAFSRWERSIHIMGWLPLPRVVGVLVVTHQYILMDLWQMDGLFFVHVPFWLPPETKAFSLDIWKLQTSALSRWNRAAPNRRIFDSVPQKCSGPDSKFYFPTTHATVQSPVTNATILWRWLDSQPNEYDTNAANQAAKRHNSQLRVENPIWRETFSSPCHETVEVA